MKRFALIGAAGFVAPRHMKAIKDVGGDLVTAMDIHESVGVLDQHFPECAFFTEFERFDRFCSKSRIDYVVVCSPNHLHQSHCMFALRIGASAICEKPLVLSERNLDDLSRWEERFDGRVLNILQLRLHDSFHTMVDTDGDEIKVEYVTPRGEWYDWVWKSDVEKSGGLETNIGVHLFDLVSKLRGRMQNVTVDYRDPRESIGEVVLDKAKVKWRLSIKRGGTPKRSFSIGGVYFDLSNGFSELHTKSYQKILAGEGFGIEDARESIRICEAIRNYH